MLPIELSWTILVFLPKCKVNNRGIGTLEVLWKVVEAIIDTHIKTAVIFNDVLHGFRACRGTETAIVEIKMSSEDCKYQPGPVIPGVLGSSESLQHPIPRPALADLGRIWSRPKGVGNLGRILENPEDGHQVEQVP